MSAHLTLCGDKLEGLISSSPSPIRTAEGFETDAGNNLGWIFEGSRFYGDNLDSILGSESSEDQSFEFLDWDDEHMSYPSSPLTPTLANTPDTVGEYPNVSTTSKFGGPKPSQDSPTQAVDVGTPQQIRFQLGKYPTNEQLQKFYPQELDRQLAFLARDLQLVTNHHIMNISAVEGMVMPPSLSASTEAILGHSYAAQSLAIVISQLSSLKAMAASSSFELEGDLQFTTTNPTSPWVNWPTNMQSVYLSKLLTTYTGKRLSVRLEQLEIADYCVATHDLMEPRELLFHDGCKVRVERCEMVSMEPGHVCNPAIVSAWGRILAETRKGRGFPVAATLDVVHKVDAMAGGDGVVSHWEEWLESAQIDLHQAELVFVPVRMRNHYTLLVISFKDGTIHSIDGVSHSDQAAWDLMADTVRTQLGRLLDRIKHTHANDLEHFSFQHVNPKWSTNDESPYSAIEVMHLMDVYDGNPTSLGSMLLNEVTHMLYEDHVRVSLKIAYVVDIVTSKINVCRDVVLAKLPRFIQGKCSNILRPSREILQYRQVFGWLADADAL